MKILNFISIDNLDCCVVGHFSVVQDKRYYTYGVRISKTVEVRVTDG